VGPTEFTWWVPLDHPAFAGHFPGRPIVPGVLVLDHAISLATLLVGERTGSWHIGVAKFLAPVVPGTALVFKLVPNANGTVAFTVQALGKVVASGRLTPPDP
jgi:3-hydroxyacyl-[acyl-carrier-protein] dehydratase